MIKVFYIIDLLIEKISSVLLIISIALILYFSLQGIVLRWFDTSFPSIDPFVRHLVFLSTFLGGVIATGRKNHIGIDILSKFLDQRGMGDFSVWLNRLINLVCVSVLIWLIFASLNFFKMELKYGKVEFFGIHSSFLIAIIPFGLSLICYRFFYLLISSFVTPDQGELK